MLAFATGYRKKKKGKQDIEDDDEENDIPPDCKTDFWKYKGDNLELDPLSRTILTVKYLDHNGYNAAFGNISVSHGKHIWKLQILKKTTKMCIGISSSTETINANFHRQKSYPNYGYNWDGSKISHKTKYQDYGEPMKSGQVITVILDLDQRELSFMNDNENLGIAFGDIVVGDTISYRLAISIVDKDDKVQLIGYMLLSDDGESENDADYLAMNGSMNGNHLVNGHDHEMMEEQQQQQETMETKEEEEIYDLDIKEIESWNHKMCKQWIQQTVNKSIKEMDGKDLLELLNKLQHENGSIAKHEALQTEYDKQANNLQTLQQKMSKLCKKNSKLEKKVNQANKEKDRVLLLYQVKEEEVEIAQKENEQLRTQLLNIQKSLTGT